MSDVLWEAEGKYVPVGFHANFYYNNAELFIVESIELIDDGYGDYKRIRLVGRKVSFANGGVVVARAGSIVVLSVPVDTPIGPGKIEIYGYVDENKSLRYQTSYGDIVMKNIKTADCPCSRYSGNDFIDCIVDYHAELLKMGVDIEIEGVEEYIPWEELERVVCLLMLASIKEKLKVSTEIQDNPYIRALNDSLAVSCGDT